MNKKMKAFSLFSGVGGFEIGAKDYFETIGFSEIDKYANQVLKYRFPNVINYGDVKNIDWSSIPDFDIVWGGSPCQDFSIAGKRAGIEGARSGLVWEFIRCLEEKKPQYFIWENVKGVMSSRSGWDFANIISAFSEAGYSLWWQVLNAKDFGVPQNRERIFVVGYRLDIGTIPEIDVKWLYEKRQRHINHEKMYLLQKGVATYAKELLLEATSSESKTFSREQMQGLLQSIRQSIPTGESSEVEGYRQEVSPNSEGSIQEVGEVSAWVESNNHDDRVFGVVSAPTEDMLLLWDTRTDAQSGKGQVQQQVGTIDDRQNGLIKALRKGESGTLLLSVQPYKERLFYSLGNGQDWENIYISKMAKSCPSLDSILEQEVPEKYFLSDQATQKLIRHGNRSVQQSTQDISSKVEETNNTSANSTPPPDSP